MLRKLKEKALGIAWRDGVGRAAETNPEWAFRQEELHEVSVRWTNQYEWQGARVFVEPLRRGFSRLVRVEAASISQPYRGIVIFQLNFGGKAYDVAIDYHDLSEINKECARRAAVYFKMQFQREGYGVAHVLPGGYVPDSRQIYFKLNRLRRVREACDFRYEVYGRFGLDFAAGTHQRAVEILRAQNSFAFEGGVTKVSYAQFLEEIARAKICIDLPGNGDFCHRLITYFAIGACVVAAPHGNALHVPLIDRTHIAYAKPDLSDLAEICERYLRNDAAREAMRRESQRYFDLYLHQDNLAAYYLRAALDLIRR